MKRILIPFLLIAVILISMAFRVDYGRNIVISQPVYEDVYLAGGNITINAPIHGDLIIAGGTIVINDSVTGDILLAGGNATFNGVTGDDIRCAGGNLHIIKNVVGDVIAAGGDVVIDQGVSIGGLLISGGDVTLNGDVTGETRGMFGQLTINGTLRKNLYCKGGSLTINGRVEGSSVLSAQYIFIGKDAAFYNDVRYWSEQKAPDFTSHMKNGRAVYDPSLQLKTEKWYFLGANSFFLLFWYLGMALSMIIITQYLFSNTLKSASETAFQEPGKSILYGLALLIGVPVAMILAIITIIGVPIALLLLTSYIILALMATVVMSIILANRINARYRRKWKFWRLVFAAFGIFILLKLALFISFVVWIVLILLTCASYGAILLDLTRRRRKAPALTETSA